MICNNCAEAADYGDMVLHCGVSTCDCHHRPIAGEPRLKHTAGARARRCPHCAKVVSLNTDGAMRRHRPGRYMPFCPGSGIKHD